MRINQLEIENYRGFEGKHVLSFSESPVTAIVGVNGAGKTSLLNVIGEFLANLIQTEFNLPLEFKDVTDSKSSCHLISSFSDGDINFKRKIEIIRNRILSSTDKFTKTLYGDDNNIESEIYESRQVYNNINIPLFISYQTNRIFKSINNGEETQEFKREDAYLNSFNSSRNYTALSNWYILQKNIENSEKVKRKDFEYQHALLTIIKRAYIHFLSHLDGTKLSSIEIEPSPNNTHQRLIFHKGNIKLEFSQLSAGEKMLTGIVLDIAYRMGIANPHLKYPLMSNGIVLIDEPDLHLHPKWQMTVLQALNATFPNIQFIVTTHSPLVINNLTNEQLVILDDFKIVSGKEVRNTYGRDVNSIIEDFMGASDRPKEIKTKLSEIEILLDEEQPNIKLAKQKLANLKSIIDPNDYDILKLETLITIEEDEADY